MNLAVIKASLADASILGSPISSHSRLAALEAALLADEAALFGTSAIQAADLNVTALTAPTGTAVTPTGTVGSTGYTYVVADVSNVGVAPATGVATTTGNATLSAVNYNVITWAAVVGHTYNIYRSVSSGTPSGLGLIGTVTPTTVAGTFSDTGITASIAAVPTANTTGSIAAAANAFIGGIVIKNCLGAAIANASGQTLTAAQVTAGAILLRSGAAGVSDALPSAAALVAALPGLKVNQGFELYIRNANTGTLTLTAGSGMTLAAGNTNTIATIHMKKLLFVFTNVTVGSEAVTVYTLDDTAY